MNSILEDIFYDPKIGLMSFDKFRAKIKDLHPEIKSKTIKEFYDNQEINQLAKKPITTSNKSYKINGPDLTFQIDLMFIPKSIKTKDAQLKKAKEEGLFPKNLFYVFLLCIDVLSRKAYVYTLPNKQLGSIMEGYEEFLNDVKTDTDIVKDTEDYFMNDHPFGIITDDGFEFDEFMDFNKERNIYVDASTAYDDHISNGNRLGIIDRLVRTVKNLVMKFVYSNDGKPYSMRQLVKSIVENYNNTSHRALDNATPNEVFHSKEARMKIFNENRQHNESVDEVIDLAIGDTVRILNKKATFSKEKPQFSKDIYTIVERSGYKYLVMDSDEKQLKRRFKPIELLKVNEQAIQKKTSKNVEQEIKANQQETKRRQVHKQLDIESSNILSEKRIRKPNSKYI